MVFDKLFIGDHPYTYARVCAMKGKLIGTEQYHRMLKMRTNEILKFLQETTYKREIDEMTVTHLGLRSAEAVLDKNLVRTLRKLKRISDGNLASVITKYLERYDIYNLKTVLRGKFTGSGEEKIEPMLLNVGKINKAVLLNLIKRDHIDDMIGEIPHILGAGLSPESARELSIHVKAARDAFKKHNNLFEIENVLDHHYYATMLEFSKRIAGQGDVFKTFLLHEIDVLNIKTLLRLKREKMHPAEIEKYLIFSGATLSRETLRRLLKINSLEELVEEIKKRGYCKRVDMDRLKKEGSLIDIETHLQHYLLEKANLLLHQHLLTVNVILGYMLAKEIEVRNLKILIKGKGLGLPEEYLGRELIAR
ncbi:MAG: V-type ATPase subunit [Candidatus Woesearchaeota archaeon]|nr:V-type ATPase subunit [Candidatus Woesearchaeota archaeon]